MLSLSWNIRGFMKMCRHPTATHTSYVCNALGCYTIEYPRCHLDFLRIDTAFKLIVHICKENTCTLTYALFHVIIMILIIIIIISLSQYTRGDWSILLTILYCTAR